MQGLLALPRSWPYALALLLVWTAITAVSLAWNLLEIRRDALTQARTNARTSYSRDLVYRRWAAGHGGVYVPITEDSPPNPYLSHIPERDIETPSGKRLTLMNPAYMMRQVYELRDEVYGVKGHITSLNLLNPDNSPDPWEKKALEAFHEGETEVSSVEDIDGAPFMRLMRPLIIEERCLKCHASQGYKEGDIRGGISVSVPLAPYWAALPARSMPVFAGHGVIWLLGLIGLGVGTQGVRRREDERKRAGKALQDSERKLIEAQAVAKLGHYVLDVETGSWTSSAELDAIFGIGEEYQKDTASWLRIVHPDSREAMSSYLQDHVLGQHQEFDKEYRIVDQGTGEEKWVHGLGHLRLDDENRPVEMFGTIQDITERKKDEEERDRLLHETGERIKELRCMYGVAQSIWIRGTLEEIFQDVLALIPMGWQYPEITRGRICLDDREFVSSPFEETEWRQSADILVAGERRGSLEVFYLEERPELDEGPFLKEQRDLIEGIAQALSEAIEHRRAEEEKENAEEHLRMAQKMEAIGTLAGGIAHDFNNILGAIIGYAEMVHEDIVDGKAPEAASVEQILKASERARELVQQILAYNREAGHEMKPVRIGMVVNEVLKLLRSALPTTIEIRSDVMAKADTAMADSTEIHQVLMNLCANAEHAMREDGGVLDVQLQPVELDAESAATHMDIGPGSYLQLTVCDTGHGMEKADLDRIFDPFFTTKTKGEGTGMGLAVVQGIVKNLGGAVAVESEIGKGTLFRVLLPSLSVDIDAADDMEAPFPRGSERVLVVDDEAALRDVHSSMLLSLGYMVTTCASGKAAWEDFLDDPEAYDLVITDLTMPQLTGVDLAEMMLNLRPSLPIILVTGYAEKLTPEDARAIGIREMIMKPLRKRELAAVVRRVLDRED